MILLKIKAKIYQYTGWYLATKKEEGNKEELELACWQMDNGFIRILSSRLISNRMPFYKRVLNFFIELYVNVKYDINKVLYYLRKL